MTVVLLLLQLLLTGQLLTAAAAAAEAPELLLHDQSHLRLLPYVLLLLTVLKDRKQRISLTLDNEYAWAAYLPACNSSDEPAEE
jgi:hypothetical protein